MTEQIAKEIYDRHGNAHLPWAECNVRGLYRYTAKQILSIPEIANALSTYEQLEMASGKVKGVKDG